MHFKMLKTAMTDWMHDKLEGKLPETWQQFEQRVQAAIHTIQRELHGQRVLVVSSGGAIAMALRHVLKAPSETVIELNLQTKNTAIAHCYFNAKTVRMTSFNHVPHLDNKERAGKITYS